jgi:RNA polymerase sigma factor (sigma-70 family)
VDAPGPLQIERVASPAEETARPDKPPARPASESAEAIPAGSDAGRVTPAAAAAAATAEPTRGSSAENPSPAARNDRVADKQASRQRRPESAAARPGESDATQRAPKSDGSAPTRRADTPAAPTVPRGDVSRLNGEIPDGSLLHRFVANREEAAFTALVRRHERLVLSVCQRVLGDWHAAQDALQVTFLVLARKAGMLDRQVPLTNWLYTVAYHAALRLRAVSARHRQTEAAAAQEWPTRSEPGADAEVEQMEIQQAVREELQSLPEEYRAPLSLCYVQGLTHGDAAREVGLPRGSMAKRLGEGLDRLRERLVVRGVSS